MAVGIHSEKTAFERAFQDLLNTTKSEPKKHLSKFLLKCQNASKQVSLKTASELIDQAENASSERKSRRLTRKILEPVVDSLKAYDKVISTLCNADPMPTAIIWGALKVIVDCTDRFTNLFTTIKTQLSALRDRIEDIQEYESLFGRSPELQRALFGFYKDVIRFWSRVDKECSRSALHGVVKAVVPLTMIKIRNIIAEIEIDVDTIHSKVQTIDLRESKEDRALNLQTRQAQQDAEMNALHGRLSNWLDPSAYQYSSDAHQRHVRQTMPGTLEWLGDDPDIRSWSSVNPQHAVLWATAAPGFGKTIACSKAIENARKDHPEAAVCYHFYQSTEIHPAREVLRSFASQLLESISINMLTTSDLQKLVQKHKGSIENIISLIALMLTETKTAFFFIDGLDEAITVGDTRVVSDTRIVLDTLTSFCLKFNGKVRFWCSSQSTALIKDLMGTAKTISLDGRNIEDVREYLHQALHDKYQGDDVDEEDQMEDICDVASDLGQKAHGSFMWAFLMKHDIECAETPAELSAIMESEVPDGLDQYFTRILHRIEKSKWPFASLLLSLVCYARRPLRLAELREAIAVLRSKDQSCIDHKQRPFPRDMQKILLPLIQIEKKDHYGQVYKVCHSTLKDFLHKNPHVLCPDPTSPSSNMILGQPLGEACLRYLRQNKFSKCLIRKADSWYIQDESEHGSAIGKDPFIGYAAKYWNTHLNMIDPDKRPSLYMQISDFVRSSNFWTCLQVQSLFVAGQFCTYTIAGHAKSKFKKRFLPHWYIHEPGNTVFGQFRTFLYEWGYFLEDCNSEKSGHGEIDRCFIPGLGPKSFLAGVQQRYPNFSLDSDNDSSAGDSQFETCSADGKLLSLINMRYDNHHDQFKLRHSQIDTQSRSPTLSVPPVIWNIASDAIDWLPYTCLKHIHDKSCICIGKPHLTTTSSCGQVIRVASKIWRLSKNNEPLSLTVENNSLAGLLLEHVECKDDLIFITSRHKVKVKPNVGRQIRMKAKQKLTDTIELDRHLVTKFYKAHTAREHRSLVDLPNGVDIPKNTCSSQLLNNELIPSIENSKSIKNMETSDSETATMSECDSSEVHGFEIEQYWSEASTAPEEHGVLIDEAPMHLKADNTDEEATTTNSSDSSSEEGDFSTGEISTDDERSTQGHGGYSDTDDGTFGQHQYFEDLLEDIATQRRDNDSDEEFHGASSGDDAFEYFMGGYMDFVENSSKYHRRPLNSPEDTDNNEKPKKKIMTKEPVASLKVYRSDGNMLRPIFKFNWSNPRPVFNSPPAIHPRKPLAVWPVTDSLLLFADYEENTWFKKKLRPPQGSRFLTIRCHFSACGKYLHIAALKSKIPTPTSDQKDKKSKNKDKKRNKKQENTETDQNADSSNDSEQAPFSLLVLTYVLSSRKTSYSPPRLIHRQGISLPTMTHPLLTFVWTEDELFTTHSGIVLSVFRIKLFPNDDQRNLNGPHQLRGSVDEHSDPVTVSKSTETKNGEESGIQVMVPEQAIYLPWSARKRPIYFVPASTTPAAENSSDDNHGVSPPSSEVQSDSQRTESRCTATVFIGPERPPIAVQRTPDLMAQLRHFGVDGSTDPEDDGLDDADDHHLPENERREQRIVGVNNCAQMIGVLLDDQKDLGGWKAYDATEDITQGQGIGTLDEMMELFDPEDDCDDVEPWSIG